MPAFTLHLLFAVVSDGQMRDSRRALFLRRRWAVPGNGVNSASAIVTGPGAGNVLNGFVGFDDGNKYRRKVFYPSRPGAAPVSKSYSGCRLCQPAQRAGQLTRGCRRPSFALLRPAPEPPRWAALRLMALDLM